MSELDVPDEAAFVIVFSLNHASVTISPVGDLRRLGRAPGRYVVFDPSALLVAVRQRLGPGTTLPSRRRFSTAYKLRVLREYQRATDGGAKTALLRREAVHSSHLALWRRARDSGMLHGPTEGDNGRRGEGA